MDDNFTVESMLKEVKGNLNKYENLLKIGESSPTEKTIKGIDSIKKTIENNLKLVKSVVTKEEDKFILGSYEELKEQLNKRYIIVKKRKIQKTEKEKFQSLFKDKTEIEDRTNLDLLSDEHQSLKNSINLSNEVNNAIMNANSDLNDQEKKLENSTQQVIKILQKIPIIEQMFGKIKFHQIKEKIILGIVIGVICFFGLYLIFHKRS
jgi:K+/H+ antiporter YhaU regulatory subunit KhtT